jgi:cold shock CspA family protein
MHGHGRVAEFDDHRGLGAIEADNGRRYRFHCTAIADGTRTIPVGVTVEFAVMAGPLGLVEATQVRRI